MRSFIFIIVFFIPISIYAQTIVTLYPIQFSDFSPIILENALSDQPCDYQFVNIYNLDVDKQYVYTRVGYYDYSGYGVDMVPEYILSHFRVYQIENRLLAITSAIPPKNDRGLSNLENNRGICDLNHLACPIFWDDGSVTTLENSYSPTYIVSEYDDRVNYGVKEIAWNNKSDSKNGIAGLIGWTTQDSSSHYWELEYTLNLWNVASGKRTMSKKIPRKENSAIGFLKITKVKYSGNGRYVIFNESGNEKYRDNQVYLEPISFLFDIETQEYLPSNRDVAFTSDVRYYVTEREGMPSLVDAETHEVLQRYDPGATMSACCFSPDDKILYMACDDLKIYQFDSHLPSSASMNWEVLE